MTQRTRGDLCPGVLRPWPAADGALVRLRVPGGHLTRTTLLALLDVAEAYGDGRVHLTTRANLQLRALPLVDGAVPREVVEAIRATGLFPHPDHELVRNVLVSPLTGLHGGRADLRPVTAELDERICATPSLARLPGRFVLVLDDGRGDLTDRTCDLGLVALSADEAQLRIGSTHWGPVVPLHEAAARLTGLARAFQQVRGDDDDAAWHVDELPATPEGRDPDPRALVSSDPPPHGVLEPGITHLEIEGGVLDRERVAGLPEQLVVTPWKSLVARAAVSHPLPPREIVCGPYVLHAVTDDDWHVTQQLSRCPEVVRWTNHPADLSEVDARARVARQQERAREGATQRYVIRDGDTPLGTCGLGRLGEASPEAMYALLPEARGRGVATAVLETLRDWAAASGRPGLTVVTVDGNTASAAVARRAGFTHAETFQDDHRGAPATLHRWRWTRS